MSWPTIEGGTVDVCVEARPSKCDDAQNCFLGCRNDADCVRSSGSGSPTPHCNADSVCVCQSDADCVDYHGAGACLMGSCGCVTDADCGGDLGKGDRCFAAPAAAPTSPSATPIPFRTSTGPPSSAPHLRACQRSSLRLSGWSGASSPRPAPPRWSETEGYAGSPSPDPGSPRPRPIPRAWASGWSRATTRRSCRSTSGNRPRRPGPGPTSPRS